MLNEYPNSFTMVQIHVGDAYSTGWGDSRKVFYGVTGTPTAWFDGLLACVGAYPNVSQQHTWYVGKYNERQNAATDVEIELSGAVFGGRTYDITATVYREPGGDASPKSMKIYLVQVLDHWPLEGGYHRNGFKQAAATVTASLLPGQSTQVTRSFTFDDDSWNNKPDIKIIAWAQDPRASAPAEIYQAAEMQWPFAQQCRQGRVDVAANGPHAAPVLLVNGSPGEPSTRIVRLSQTDPFELYMDAPPSGPASAHFAMYVWAAEPSAVTVTPHPKNLGDMCFPTPVTGGSPQPNKIWNNIGREPYLGTPDFPSSPAPSVVVSRPSGLGLAVTATFQGFLMDNGSAADQPASITNAVVVVSQ